MAHLTPASILAAMDSTCSPSEMMAYNSHHHHHHPYHHHHHHHHHHDSGMASFDDSDSDSSSCSGSSSSSFSTSSLTMQDNLLHHSVSVAPAVMHVSNGSMAHNINMNSNMNHNMNTNMNHSINHNVNNNNNINNNVAAVSPSPTPSGPITYHYFCNFPTCGYHSARSDPVKRHRDTHYPDYKPYICNYCQSSSARRDSTREHCLKQHKDDSENAFRYDTMIPKPEGWIAYEPKRSPWPPLMA